MKKWIYLIIVAVAVFSIGSCRGCHRAVADYEGDVEEIWQVRGDGSKRISDYEWFEGKYRSIQAEIINIQNYVDANEEVLDQITIVNRWIAEYNARSNEYTRAMWKSDRLPYMIEHLTIKDFKN
jgi:hypothetical protein